MQAGEEYIKSSLEESRAVLHTPKRPMAPAATNSSLSHKAVRTPEPASISYQ
jgi:hypothetical protein